MFLTSSFVYIQDVMNNLLEYFKMQSRNHLSFRSTWVEPQFLAMFLLPDLQFFATNTWVQRKRSTYIFTIIFLMERKFKQWWSSTSPITYKPIASHLNWTRWTHTKKITNDIRCWESKSWLGTCAKMWRS